MRESGILITVTRNCVSSTFFSLVMTLAKSVFLESVTLTLHIELMDADVVLGVSSAKYRSSGASV